MQIDLAKAKAILTNDAIDALVASTATHCGLDLARGCAIAQFDDEFFHKPFEACRRHLKHACQQFVLDLMAQLAVKPIHYFVRRLVSLSRCKRAVP